MIPGIQDIFSIIFEKAGFEFEIKKDGEDLLKNNFATPDLFLVDKQLSGYSGLDICRHLKNQKATKDIPDHHDFRSSQYCQLIAGVRGRFLH